MKNFLIYALVLFSTYCNGQITGTLSPTPNNFKSYTDPGRGSAPIMQYVARDLMREDKMSEIVSKTLGSPYYTVGFKEADIFIGEKKIGQLYLRLNGYNGEIEVLDEFSSLENYQALLPTTGQKVIFKDENLRPIVYKNFKAEAKGSASSYLIELVNTENYSLYKKFRIKYNEGRAAANSMLRSTPNRFVEYSEYYLETPFSENLIELKSSNRKFVKIIPENLQPSAQEYLEKNELNIKNENDLIKLVEFLNTKL